MWDADRDEVMRFEAAKAALPYFHPKLSPVEKLSSTEPTEVPQGIAMQLPDFARDS
jgi:hypothetical protein